MPDAPMVELNVPFGQAVHVLAELAPSASLNVPAGHFWQFPLLFDPRIVPNVPGRQVEQIAAFLPVLYVPIGHSVHVE